MKQKPSLDEFRNGGSEGAVEAPSRTVPSPASKQAPGGAERANKTIRLRRDLESRLKEDSYKRSISDGARVTESDIIEEALVRYFGLPQ